MVIADTSVWIEALRRPASPERRELDRLLEAGELHVTSVVVAELVQGARSLPEGEALAEQIRPLPAAREGVAVGIRAGRIGAALRKRGRLLPLADLLVAGAVLENGASLYSLDSDFDRVQGIKRHRTGPA